MKTIYYNMLLVFAVSCAIVSCNSKEDYLSKAYQLSSYNCIDSLAIAWDCLQEANKETKKVVGLDVARIIVHKSDSLFDSYLQKLELDSAARCLEIMEPVVSYYGEICFNTDVTYSTEDNTDLIVSGGKKEKLEVRRERLADSYYKQARSAERLWKRFNDHNEHRLMMYSDSLAHNINPNKY